ncbi:MAG: DNA polymerase III subunit delta [Clostridia bacterium]|nr:DNA polymerase III subunit delta [Clostridia bacterium]
MNIIKESDFRKEIKSKPGTGYLFFGEEDYMKSFALSTATEAISPDPTFGFFNEIKLDSFSYSPEALLDAIMPLPMMADRKLIVLSGIDFNAMKQGELDALCSVLSQLEDYDYNTLIINTSADRFDPGILPKRPSAMLQKLSEHLTAVNFEKNTPAKLAAWVGKHFEHNGVSASPEICALTIDRCGRDMFNLASETDKLAFYVKASGRSEVTREDVMRVAIPAAEYDAFAFTNAIGARKKEEALDILRDLRQRKADPIIIMSEITKTVCDMSAVALMNAEGATVREISDALKIHEYRVSIILKNNVKPAMCRHMTERCREADLELKNSGDGYAVLEKLICTI